MWGILCEDVGGMLRGSMPRKYNSLVNLAGNSG